jgi:hypothetical protein
MLGSQMMVLVEIVGMGIGGRLVVERVVGVVKVNVEESGEEHCRSRTSARSAGIHPT